MEIEQGTPDCTGGTSTHENNLEIQIYLNIAFG
jgi:hypothetical protein